MTFIRIHSHTSRSLYINQLTKTTLSYSFVLLYKNIAVKNNMTDQSGSSISERPEETSNQILFS